MAAPVIHPSAFVSPRAELGEDVVVGPCALIEEDVVIGARTRVDAFASIKRYTTMGEDNHVHSHAMVGGEPQDLKFHGEVSRLIIGSQPQQHPRIFHPAPGNGKRRRRHQHR